MATCVSLVAVSGKQGMNSVTITPNQLLAPSSESIDTCQMILLNAAEYQRLSIPPDDYAALLGIDAATILLVWTWGFMSIISMQFIGYVIGVVKRMIDMA